MRRSWMVGAVGLAVLVFATTAAAAVVGSSQRMRFRRATERRSAGSRRRTTRRLTPIIVRSSWCFGRTLRDAQSQNLGACSFGRAFSRASNTRRTLVTNQMNLSWEYAAANPVTASERMNVFFSNGDVAFLGFELVQQADPRRAGGRGCGRTSPGSRPAARSAWSAIPREPTRRTARTLPGRCTPRCSRSRW